MNRTAQGIGLALAVLCASTGVAAQMVQERVHHMAHSVMPFDMRQTLHVFRMHLQHEAMSFQQGDFGDPQKLHGEDMPGLKELRAGVAKIRLAYAELPDEAEIVFRAREIRVITTIHRCFGAQLSVHGADARA